MKITIELNDTEAALLWANQWKNVSVEECVRRAVQDAVSEAASNYRTHKAKDALRHEFQQSQKPTL